MNLSLIQNVAWLGSAALAGYLGWYLFDFKQHQIERLAPQPNAIFSGPLNDVVRPEPIDTADFDFPVVERLYHQMNWTGKPKPKPVDVVAEEVDDSEEPLVKVASLLDVLFIRAASFDPAQSLALVSYTDSNLRRTAGEDGLEQLNIGDHLPTPHQSIFVQKILGKGVLFGFEVAEGDEEREPELLSTPQLESGIEIVKVGPGGVLAPKVESLFGPALDGPIYNPLETVQIGANRFRVGKEDAKQFEDNFASIIAMTDHRQHHDPDTRQPDGIEITKVPAGSMAAKHGAKEGDIIKSVNGHPVTTTQEAIKYAQNNAEKYTTWEIVVENQGVERTVYYEVPEE
jgi:hypothetical protein